MITILGRVISKKNSKQVGVNRYTHRIFFTSSKSWKNFAEDAISQLTAYNEKYIGKINIQYIFYFKGGMWLDVDNAIAGINDVLQESGIIDEDRNVVSGSFKVIPFYRDWKTEITITQL